MLQHAKLTAREPTVRVHYRSARDTTGLLRVGNLVFRCALGGGGLRYRKREGDGATPIGRWVVRAIHYRPDRMLRPTTGVPVRGIQPDDGWCDAPGDRNYNRRVSHPYPASAERMWREDAVYDCVVELGYNDAPRRKGLGSAIFMHFARPGFSPTAGCIALRGEELRRVVTLLRAGSVVQIGP